MDLTDWMTGIQFPAGAIMGFCLFASASRRALGPIQAPIQWSPGIKRLGREAENSPPSDAEVKICGPIPPLPQYNFNTFSVGKQFRICQMNHSPMADDYEHACEISLSLKQGTCQTESVSLLKY